MADLASADEGFSKANIRNFYYDRWRKGGRNVCALINYDPLFLPTANKIEWYGLSKPRIKTYLRQKKLLVNQWAKLNSFSASEVSRAICGSRASDQCRLILEKFASEIKGFDGAILAELAELRKTHNSVAQRIEQIEQALRM